MLSSSSSSVRRSTERRGFKVFHKGLILVFTPLLIEMIFIGSLAYVLVQLDKESVRETRYRRVAASCAKVTSLSNDSVVSILGYFQSGSSAFLDVYRTDSRQIDERLKGLLQISQGDPLCENAGRQLAECNHDVRPLTDELVEFAKRGMRGLEAAAAIEDTRNKLYLRRDKNLERMVSISASLERMAEESNERLKRLEYAQSQILRYGFALNLIACFVLLFFYRKDIYGRLRTVKENTLKLGQGVSLPAVLAGSDEIAQLDTAFHKMDMELKEAAERENSLFQNASDVICVLTEDLHFEKINPACQKLWGLHPEYLTGKSIKVLFPPDMSSSAQIDFAAIKDNSGTDIELKLLSSSGMRVDSLWSTYFSEQEKKIYCIVHDVTERKQIEEARKSFITLMSSDLRLPLSKISSDVDALLENWQAEISAVALNKLSLLKGNLSRLLRLVNDLLQMVQAADGKIVSQKEEHDVEPLLKQCILELEGLAKKQKVQFKISCDAKKWYVAQNRIMQVIANLCSNAVKFSPVGGLVSISAELVQDRYVEVRIKDQGRGVPPQHQQSIFEKFKQVEAADGKRKSGTGLGLPICKEIVEEHNGNIGVFSEEGEGSTFWFRIPVSLAKFEEIGKDTTLALSKKVNNEIEPERAKTAQLVPNIANTQTIRGSRLTLMQKGILLVGVPLLFELAFVGSISVLLLQTNKYNKEELHQREIASTAYKFLNAYFGAALIGVRYHSFENWQKFDSAAQEIIDSSERLQKLLAGDRTAESQWRIVDKVHSKFRANIERIRGEYERKGFSQDLADQIMPERYEMWTYAVGIRKRMTKIIDESERKQFLNPEKQEKLRQTQGLFLLLGLAANAGISWFLARFFSSDISARLAVQADNASRLSRDIPLNSLLPGTDEIAQLDFAFHQTAERLAETRRKERAVFDNSRDLACVLSNSGRFLTVNSAAEEFTGYAKEELLENSLFDLMNPDAEEQVAQLLKEDLSSGKQLELALRGKDEKLLYMLFSFTRNSEQEQIYCIGHDISDRKELEQIKQDFLSVVSHDLRTPLTSVNLTANLIEEGATGPVGSNALPIVHDISVQGDQLIELINDLLDLEKLEAKKMDLVRVSKNAGKLIEPALAVVEERYPDHVFIAKSRKSDALVCGDSERIAQAFTYILSFLAQKSAPESDIYIQSEEQDGSFTWKISQNGMTLDERQINHLFDRFALIGTEQRNSDGQLSILAMPLARSIIEAHGGKLAVQSREEGTVFQVVLPLALKEASAS